MANIIGPGRAKALETRRSPLIPEHFVCMKCPKDPRRGYLRMKRCRVFQDGLLRPGIVCPGCGTAYVEQEEQPEPVT